jgi:hypothetical protein
MRVLNGTANADNLAGTLNKDIIYGWEGNDQLNGAGNDDILYGGEGNDNLFGAGEHDLLIGNAGNDYLFGGDGIDVIFGGKDDDILNGNAGNDFLFGELGNDVIYSVAGSDTIYGGEGNNTFVISKNSGSEILADATIIMDFGQEFNSSPNRIGLTDDLAFTSLKIYQGTGDYAKDVIIEHLPTEEFTNGRFLAVLKDVHLGEIDTTKFTITPNYAPEDITLTNNSVNENSVAGTAVGDLSTLDPDLGDFHSYTLIDDAQGKFILAGNQLQVATDAVLDFEAISQHTITLRSTDLGGLSVEKSFNITVNNINEPPVISAITPVVINEDSSTSVPFTIFDPETSARDLTLSVSSSNPALIPNQNLILGGTDTNRTVSLTPLANQFGTALITLNASDGVNNTTQLFNLTVQPVNDAPILTRNTGLNINLRETLPITNTQLQLTDIDNTTTQLTYTLTTIPTNGYLLLNGIPLVVGNTFTQADIDSNRLTYSHGIINQLTDNDTDDLYPQISGNNVVWHGFDGNDNEIYLFNGAEIIQLTNNLTDDRSARISGNNIVWRGFDGNDNEIYLYTNGSTIPLTDNNNIDDFSPNISGNNVSWLGNDSNDNEVFFYNGNNTLQLTDNSTIDTLIDIDNSTLLWHNFDSDDFEIYLYSNNIITQLTDNNVYDQYAQISGSNVVWQSHDENDWEINLYNGVAIVPLTNNEMDDYFPQISGNHVVWFGLDGSDYEIYLYDGNNIVSLTNNETDDFDPQISGNNVVWENNNGNENGYEIYFYNGSNTVQLTNSETDDWDPQISNNNVVWQGGDGNDTEIFLAKLGNDSFSFTASDGAGGFIGNTTFGITVPGANDTGSLINNPTLGINDPILNNTGTLTMNNPTFDLAIL